MWRRLLPLMAVFLLALAIYLRTLVPYVFVSDFTEFQYQPLRLGLPHPNGFPFYMLLGWLWSHLPWETPAWRMNLLSAVGGALAVTVTAGFAWRLTRRFAVALLAGGLLALSPTFWFYSLAAERYTLNLALLAGAVWAMWEAGQAGKPRLAYLSALLLGLSLAVHPSDALIIPFWLAYLAWRLPASRRQPRLWLKLAALGAAPLLLYAYVPWRWLAFSSWPITPGIGRSSAVYHGMVHVWYQPQLTLDLLLEYIGGLGGYAVGLAQGGWQEALARLPDIVPYWRAEMAWPVFLFVAAGAIGLMRRDAALALMMVGFGVFLSLVVAYIQQGKWEAYLLPAFWVVLFLGALAVDLAARELGARWKPASPPASETPSPSSGDRNRSDGETHPRAARIAGGALLPGVAIVLLFLFLRRYDGLDQSRNMEAARWWQSTLQQPIELGAGLLGNWSDFTPLWYMQQIEGQRPDLVGLFPPDMDQVIIPWLGAGRPLYLAAPLHGWAQDLPGRYTLVPWGNLVRILRQEEQISCPTLSNAVQSPPDWPFAVRSWEADQPLAGGMPAALQFCWRATEPVPRNTFLTLELRRDVTSSGGEGAGFSRPEWQTNEPLVSQWYPSDVVPAGTEALARLPMRLPAGLPPGQYALTLVPYLMQEDGSAQPWPRTSPLELGQVQIGQGPAFRRALLEAETAPLVPFRAGPLLLRAWQLSRLPVRPGDPIQLDLLWEVRDPIREPLTLSVDFWNRSGHAASTPSQLALSNPPEGGWPPGTLLRASYSLSAPRGWGDQLYLVEPRLQAGGKDLGWWPTGHLPLGIVQVKDRPHNDRVPENALSADASFGNIARLVGYSSSGTTYQSTQLPGYLPLTLFWRPTSETDRSYKVFIHLVDDKGQIVAQHDSIPAGGTLPTSVWLPGEIISDTHKLSLPADLPPGTYTLQIGLYLPETGERPPVASPLPNRDNALELERVQVVP
jgi:hypothetical protein